MINGFSLENFENVKFKELHLIKKIEAKIKLKKDINNFSNFNKKTKKRRII